MQDFRNVEAWKKAHALVLKTYAATKDFPREETFGVTMQVRRSAMNVATRIAEGSGKENSEYAVELRRAAASCGELEYLILLAHDLRFWDVQTRDELTVSVVEVRKMIFGLLRKL